MGFRSYVRHFRGAILGLLCPSEAWCFAAGRWFFPWCFPIWGPDVKVAKSHSSSKRKKEPKASFSIGFRSYVRHFRGCSFWGFSVLQRHGVLLPGGDFFHGVFPSEDQQQQQQQKPLQQQAEKVARIHSSSKRKKSSQKHHFRDAIFFSVFRGMVFQKLR